MRIIEVILAKGHPNITAKHPTTFEITKDHEITEKADCIVAIKASKGANDLNPKFKTLAQKQSARITAIFEAKGLKEIVKGFGHPKLSFEHKSDLVGRKSQFVCNRTLMIKADKSSKNFSKEFVKAIKSPNQEIKIILIAEK